MAQPVRRVLLYSHFFPPSTGGVETVADALATALCQHDLHVEVVTQTAGTLTRPRPFAINRRPSSARLMALVTHANVALMMGFNPMLAALVRGMRKPLVWVHGNHDLACPKSYGYRWQEDRVCQFELQPCLTCLREDHSLVAALRDVIALQGRRLVFDSCIHVACSESVRRRLPGGKVHVIHNGVDMQEFRPRPDIRRDVNKVVFVARLIPEKGADLLVDAVRIARERGAAPFHVVIHGVGPQFGILKRMVTEWHLEGQVHLAGSTAHHLLPQELASSVVMANPQRWDWTLGVSAIEAMACGCPVVSTRPEDPSEIPEDVAWLTTRGCPSELADALIALRHDETRRTALEHRALAFVRERHDLDQVVQQYVELLTRGC